MCCASPTAFLPTQVARLLSWSIENTHKTYQRTHTHTGVVFIPTPQHVRAVNQAEYVVHSHMHVRSAFMLIISGNYPSARTCSEGYRTWSVCQSVSQSVCLSTTILALQATKRHQSDTNSSSTTSDQKLKWRFC